MKEGDRVTYTLAWIRYNHVDSVRANAVGVIHEIAKGDEGQTLIGVRWQGIGLDNVTHWCRPDMLRIDRAA